MGFDRSTLLAGLGGRPGSRLLSNGDAIALVRDGRKARHIGPLFADSPDRALAMVNEIVRSESGPLLIDAVNEQEEFLKGLTGSGWTIERPFQRMRFGRATAPARGTAVRRRRPGIWIGHAMHHSEMNSEVRRLIAEGTVIPAHPLALDADRTLDTTHQRALTRYYIDAGAGGLAVGVHTTQFAIRDVGLYRPVLELAAETAASWTKRPLALVAGLAGPTQQAIAEAKIALGIGYHAGLLSLAAMKSASEDEIVAHCAAVAREIPLVGFYLQPAVGGVILSADFWRRFAAIDNVIAIKIAPFNRYRTLDVLRGVAAAGALDRIALYTGNDDHILLDLTLPFDLRDRGVTTRTYFRGGLLGHWSVWTASAIKQFEMCRAARHKDTVPADLLALDARVTDCNSAFFDVANNFHGCIAGCHEILRRQGLLEGIWCLDPAEGLSPGQMQEIDRVCNEHADLSRRRFRRRPLAEMARMTAPPEPFIRLRNVRKVYRSQGAEFLAVSDVTMDVQEGRADLAGRPVRLRQDHRAEDTGRASRRRRRHHPDRQRAHAVRSRARHRHGVSAGAAVEMANHPRQRAAAGGDRRPADEGRPGAGARSSQSGRACRL